MFSELNAYSSSIALFIRSLVAHFRYFLAEELPEAGGLKQRSLLRTLHFCLPFFQVQCGNSLTCILHFKTPANWNNWDLPFFSQSSVENYLKGQWKIVIWDDLCFGLNKSQKQGSFYVISTSRRAFWLTNMSHSHGSTKGHSLTFCGRWTKFRELC